MVIYCIVAFGAPLDILFIQRMSSHTYRRVGLARIQPQAHRRRALRFRSQTSFTVLKKARILLEQTTKNHFSRQLKVPENPNYHNRDTGTVAAATSAIGNLAGIDDAG